MKRQRVRLYVDLDFPKGIEDRVYTITEVPIDWTKERVVEQIFYGWEVLPYVTGFEVKFDDAEEKS